MAPRPFRMRTGRTQAVAVRPRRQRPAKGFTPTGPAASAILDSARQSRPQRPAIFSAASSCMPGITWLYVSKVIPMEA